MISDVYMAVEETNALKELDGNKKYLTNENPSEPLKGSSKSDIGSFAV